MESIREKIKNVIKDCIGKYLPDCSDDDFEEKGAVYYMNADDGTVFDWGTNDRLCEFMVFYEKSKMGAVKLNLKKTGSAVVYIYANEGKDFVKEEEISLCTENEALSLAILLFNVADKEKKYDSNIDKMDFARKINEEEREEFLSNYK